MPYYQMISVPQAYRLLHGPYGTRILDVRDSWVYEEGHIPGAVHVPMAQVGYRVPRLMPGRQRPILIYCQGGGKSRVAAQVLAVLGYRKLYCIDGFPRPLFDSAAGN